MTQTTDAATAWQPIGSPPKAGDFAEQPYNGPVLIWGAGFYEPTIMRWDDFEQDWVGSVDGSDAYDGKGRRVMAHGATHWQPVPEPPNAK